MGAGKSSVGPRLAKALGLDFIDTDSEIERDAGRSVAAIFETEGEASFREREKRAAAAAARGAPSVIALGGGALQEKATRAMLRDPETTVVFLDASLETLTERIGTGEGRPLWNGASEEILAQRLPDYRSEADIVLATDDLTVDEAVDRLVTMLGSGESSGRVPIELGERSYEVIVGRSLLDRVDAFVPPVPGAERAMLMMQEPLRHLVDPVVAGLRRRGLDVSVIEVENSEQAKSAAVAERVQIEMAAVDFHRDDLVVGLGGGVVTDLAGFVASTYSRGMRWVALPTTLLGQVDAAVGGKTGINLPLGKNLVGTFHHPLVVVCDVAVLATLPERELRSALAEVVKYGLISDPDLLVWLQDSMPSVLGRNEAVLEEVVGRCVGIKARYVFADETDIGLRQNLNYGHTFGHAIEHLEAGRLRHGESVSLGMMAAAYAARALGRIDESAVAFQRDLLNEAGLPIGGSYEIADLETVWRRDKKYRHGIKFVLLAEIGRAEAGITVPREVLAGALAELASPTTGISE